MAGRFAPDRILSKGKQHFLSVVSIFIQRVNIPFSSQHFSGSNDTRILSKRSILSAKTVTKFDAVKIETEKPGLFARTADSFYHFKRSVCLSVANPSSNNTSGKPDTENIHFIYLEPLSSGKLKKLKNG